MDFQDETVSRASEHSWFELLGVTDRSTNEFFQLR